MRHAERLAQMRQIRFWIIDKPFLLKRTPFNSFIPGHPLGCRSYGLAVEKVLFDGILDTTSLILSCHCRNVVEGMPFDVNDHYLNAYSFLESRQKVRIPTQKICSRDSAPAKWQELQR